MGLAANLRAERKARLVRLGADPKSRFVERPIQQASPIELPPARRPTPMQKWLDKFEPLPEPTYPTVLSIKQCVCAHFKVSILELDSCRRTADIVMPRQIGMYLARSLTPRSFPDIAHKFGRRDHTTAIYAAQKIQRLIRSNWEVAYDVAHIEALLS